MKTFIAAIDYAFCSSSISRLVVVAVEVEGLGLNCGFALENSSHDLIVSCIKGNLSIVFAKSGYKSCVHRALLSNTFTHNFRRSI